VALIPQLAAHLIAAGGKRLRPLLTLASAQLCHYRGDAHIPLAASVEFIHTATLLHDDVVDDSKLRRGQDTANAVWGNKSSVLVGDFLFSRAFQLMVDTKSIDVLRILADASSTIAEGEVHQLLTANNLATTKSDYNRVIYAKTASLFAAACEIGAVISDAGETKQTALRDYGMNLGLAFQISDDAFDYYGLPGKDAGDDFRDGKVTLPLILAYERGHDAEKAFWQKCIEQQNIGDGDFARAIDLLHRHNALNDALTIAKQHAATAIDHLSVFADGAIKHLLADTADYAANR
jgi:octaprenyl-diphosphate synthase